MQISSSASSSSPPPPCNSPCLHNAICRLIPNPRPSSARPTIPSLSFTSRNPSPCLCFHGFRYAYESRFWSVSPMEKDATLVFSSVLGHGQKVGFFDKVRVYGYTIESHHFNVAKEGVEKDEFLEKASIHGCNVRRNFDIVEEDIQIVGSVVQKLDTIGDVGTEGFSKKVKSHEFNAIQQYDIVEEDAEKGRSHLCNVVQRFNGVEDVEKLTTHEWNIIHQCNGFEDVEGHGWNVVRKFDGAEEHVENVSNHGCNVVKTFDRAEHVESSGAETHSIETRESCNADLPMTSEDVFHVLKVWETGSTSIENTIIIMQRCRKTKNLAYARSIYLHVCSNGLSAHKAVENYIVPMFVECGSTLDAQLVFYRLAHRKEHSWTSIILGHCEQGAINHAFLLHRKMQEDNINPSVHTFLALLKACTKLKDVEKGWNIHLEVLHHGFDKHASIAPALINMYSQCGMLIEALEVFKELTYQDELSWSRLIAGYVEHGPQNEALKLFDQMKLAGVSPSGSIFSGTFKVCGALGIIEKGYELHTELVMKGLDRDNFVGTSLVCMYAKCGSIEDSRESFQRLPDRDVVSWNTLIAGYLDSADGEEALNCFAEMKMQGVSPDAVTYSCSLKACGILRSIDKGREIHTEIVLTGIENDLSISNNLIGMYAKCESVLESQHVFNYMPVKNAASWTSLIAGFADHGLAAQALDYIESMQFEGISPDTVIFACSLNACCILGDLDKARKKHTDIVQRGFEKDPAVGSTLVSMYAKLGAVAEAQNAFDKLRVRSVVEWTALTTGYIECRLYKEAIKYLDLMEQDGIVPNSITFICALTAYGILEEVEKGQEIHTAIVFRGLETDVHAGNSLIGMYGRCGLLFDAEEVFKKLLGKDIVSWNTLISAFVEHEPSQAALNLFDEMQMQGQTPNTVTFINIFKACGHLGALDMGREIHMKLRRSGFNLEPSLSNALISMYAKCGSVSEAQEVFDRLQVRDVVAWSTMIKAYGVNHKGQMAMQYFEDMQEDKVKPDAITFSCLLLACSHASLVHEGKAYFKVMRDKYGIMPETEHYTSIIDLLARSGRLYEAEQFITMCCPISEGTWSALLSGCKTYGELELGSRCFQQLVDINPDIAAWYVLMADIYATAGRWDDVMWIEELRKHIGAAKKPAKALIEVDKKIHEFVVGNDEHGYDKVLKCLNSMSSSLKKEGHLPNLDLVLNSRADVGKESALCEHAEKLALAFGLLSTSPGVTLHVTKNLRMCSDCHNTSKILSQVEKREIILRDDCCVHHFKDGLCSCGDAF